MNDLNWFQRICYRWPVEGIAVILVGVILFTISRCI